MIRPLRLHGYPVSNYFNIARAALLEKQLEHDVVICRASQDPDFLAMNPMGKIPVLETARGWVAETVAIVEFLDDYSSVRSLRPADPFERARARQIVNIVQMYVEAQSRSLFLGVFAEGEVPAPVEANARAMLVRAAKALSLLMSPAPFLFGDQPSGADLFAFYNLDIAERVTRFRFNWSMRDAIGGLAEWDAAMRSRSSTDIVLADFQRSFDQYLIDHKAPYREPFGGPSSGLSIHA